VGDFDAPRLCFFYKSTQGDRPDAIGASGYSAGEKIAMCGQGKTGALTLY
jgi:hypothetical protein